MTLLWFAVLVCAYLFVISIVEGQLLKAEGLFIVDNRGVDSYVKDIPGDETYAKKRVKAVNEILKDIAYSLSEVNRIFLSFQPALKIELYLKKVIIMDDNLFPAKAILPGTGNAISSSKSLDQFEDWLVSKKYHSTYKYDFAYLWTGYNLHGTYGSTGGGIANMGEICNPRSAVGIGELSGTYLTASVTAHEIGHILGADHTSPTSQDIMTSVVDSANTKRWTFSKISIAEIKEVLSDLKNNCLLSTDPKSTKPNVAYTAYKGRLLDADGICRRSLKNIESYMCKSWILYDKFPPLGDRVCLQIYCAIPGTSYCKSAYASEGLVCDSGKRCSRGKCSPEATAPKNLIANCTFGDQKVITDDSVDFVGSCEEYIDTEGPSSCYERTIKEKCCGTCHEFYTGIKGCEYGDQSEECTEHEKGEVCPFNKHICCDYCRGYRVKRSPGWNNKTVVILPHKHHVTQERLFPLKEKGLKLDKRKEG